jgi:hypothetical protein
MIVHICIAVLAILPCFMKFKHEEFDYWGEEE